jgi:hypothetical protein
MVKSRIVLLIPLVLALAACHRQQQQPSAASTADLRFGELSFLGSDGAVGLQLHDDGRVEMDGKQVARLTPDGRVLDAQGKETSHLDKDGRFVASNGTVFGVITPDGVFKNNDGQEIRLADDGTGVPGITVQGLTAETKRAALLVLVAYFSVSEISHTEVSPK